MILNNSCRTLYYKLYFSLFEIQSKCILSNIPLELTLNKFTDFSPNLQSILTLINTFLC